MLDFGFDMFIYNFLIISFNACDIDIFWVHPILGDGCINFSRTPVDNMTWWDGWSPVNNNHNEDEKHSCQAELLRGQNIIS